MQIPEVLLREQLRRRHEGRLASGGGCRQRGDRRHDGLPRTHVTLQKSMHRCRFTHVGKYLVEGEFLGAGELVRQSLTKPGHQPTRIAQRRRPLSGPANIQLAQAETLRYKLLERDPTLAWMHPAEERLQLASLGRGVENPQGLIQRRPILRQPIAQVVSERRALQDGQSLPSQPSEALLMQTLCGRVDRRQHVGRRLHLTAQHLILRVYHLQPCRSRANVAEAPDARTACQVLLLSSIEMKKPECDRARPISDPTKQGTAAAKNDLGELKLALHQHFRTWAQSTQRLNLRSVLVTDGQEAQEITDSLHVQTSELFREPRADTFQDGDRRLECWARGDRGVRQPESRPSQPPRLSGAPQRRSRLALDRAHRNTAT